MSRKEPCAPSAYRCFACFSIYGPFLSFTRSADLRRHERNFHSRNKAFFQCTFKSCKYKAKGQFFREDELDAFKAHIQNQHSPIPQEKCNDCSAAFLTYYELYQHSKACFPGRQAKVADMDYDKISGDSNSEYSENSSHSSIVQPAQYFPGLCPDRCGAYIPSYAAFNAHKSVCPLHQQDAFNGADDGSNTTDDSNLDLQPSGDFPGLCPQHCGTYIASHSAYAIHERSECPHDPSYLSDDDSAPYLALFRAQRAPIPTGTPGLFFTYDRAGTGDRLVRLHDGRADAGQRGAEIAQTASERWVERDAQGAPVRWKERLFMREGDWEERERNTLFPVPGVSRAGDKTANV